MTSIEVPAVADEKLSLLATGTLDELGAPPEPLSSNGMRAFVIFVDTPIGKASGLNCAPNPARPGF